MAFKQTSISPLHWLIGALLTVVIGGGLWWLSTVHIEPESLQGRLVSRQNEGRPTFTIQTIESEQIEKGTEIPPSNLVIMKLPQGMKNITLRTLFGFQSEDVRFWGICLEPNPAVASRLRKEGKLPGKVFLSAAERRHREEEAEKKRLNNARTLNVNTTETQSIIRHQLDVFTAGLTCYVMTQKKLLIGTDNDDDWLNTALERGKKTNPNERDTDGDGLFDGLEVFRSLTDPTSDDTDGDGLKDGQEDADKNGYINSAETNPAKRDTDGDKLCDGRCLENGGRSLYGEDMNLNGIVDQGETNPLKEDSDGDGILDEQEYLNCVLGLSSCNYSAFSS